MLPNLLKWLYSIESAFYLYLLIRVIGCGRPLVLAAVFALVVRLAMER